MSLSEADTRAKLIDPALHSRGWKGLGLILSMGIIFTSMHDNKNAFSCPLGCFEQSSALAQIRFVSELWG